jgi:hypothetical protein
MTNKALMVLLEDMWSELRQTEHGWTEGNGGGPHWMNAERKHQQMLKALDAPSGPALVFPIASDLNVLVGGMHPTAGLAHNWALDFICHAGLGICAPEAATVTRFSGHDPSDDQADKDGVYGWTTYLRTPAGYEYFITHQGRRYPTLRVGMNVQPGDLLGFVGDQRYRSDHAHIGVTSPKGDADAKARITAVSKAPRVS